MPHRQRRLLLVGRDLAPRRLLDADLRLGRRRALERADQPALGVRAQRRLPGATDADSNCDGGTTAARRADLHATAADRDPDRDTRAGLLDLLRRVRAARQFEARGAGGTGTGV